MTRVIEWNRTDRAADNREVSTFGSDYEKDDLLEEKDDWSSPKENDSLESSRTSVRARSGADERDIVHESPNWTGEGLRLLQARGFKRINNPRGKT